MSTPEENTWLELPFVEGRLGEDFRVSEHNLWHDSVWHFSNPTPGVTKSKSTIRWDSIVKEIEAPGVVLSELVESLKRFVWGMMKDPREGKALSASSLSSIQRSLKTLVGWMFKNHYSRIDQLDNKASWEFRDYLVFKFRPRRRHKNLFDEPQPLSCASLNLSLSILALLHRQRLSLEEAGISPPTEAPYDGRTPFDIATDATGKDDGGFDPLPDEIAVPLINAAVRLLGAPADDVIALQSLVSSPIQGRYKSKGYPPKKRLELITSFQFSTIHGEPEPWRSPIVQKTSATLHQKSALMNPPQQLRNLIQEISSAALIVLQSSSGIRISEVVGLKAGYNTYSGLPNCIEIARSRTGTNDIYYLKGLETKISGQIRKWVIGLKPIDSSEVPPTVRAIQVLFDLFKPWRKLGKRSELIVGFCKPKGLPRDIESISAPSSSRLLINQKSFMMNHVSINWEKLPSKRGVAKFRTQKHEALTTHAWRSTFALFVFRTNPSLLAAVSQHFKHVSLMMTEQNYIKNDPELLETFDSVRIQQTVSLFADFRNGKRNATGGASKILTENKEEIPDSKPHGEDHQRTQIEKWVVENDLRIWFSEEGKCLIGLSPDEAECHRLGESIHWSNQEPNYKTRCASVCVGCKCFLVDHEHLEFWRNRRDKNRETYKTACATGYAKDFTLALRRAQQSETILKAIDPDEITTSNHD